MEQDTTMNCYSLFNEDVFPMNFEFRDDYPPDSEVMNKKQFIIEYEMTLMMSAQAVGELPALAKILRVPQPVMEIRLKEHYERLRALGEQVIGPIDPNQYYNTENIDGNGNTDVDENIEPIPDTTPIGTNDVRDKYQPFCMCGAENLGVCVCEFAERQDLPEDLGLDDLGIAR